ncbi:ribosomal RNA processing protein 36 homolog isoform X2 [Periplaneta americana]
MSFEELQRLKEELGSKVYNEAMFGSRKSTEISFKRDNKNRPREMSSKRPLPTENLIIPTKRTILRDPRFDSLCGSFNEKAFQRSYSFINKIREKEKEHLKEEMKTEANVGKKEKIKYLLQRMENQDREERKRKKKLEKKRQERNTQIELLKQGKKPIYYKKSERKIIDLVEQYEELKKGGKLHKHIEKHRKKNAQKDRKKLKAVKST